MVGINIKSPWCNEIVNFWQNGRVMRMNPYEHEVLKLKIFCMTEGCMNPSGGQKVHIETGRISQKKVIGMPSKLLKKD